MAGANHRLGEGHSAERTSWQREGLSDPEAAILGPDWPDAMQMVVSFLAMLGLG